ncbi:transcriptional regulator [Nonomuraea mesophila]|uniref:Transcriptional regulator n=1 Tax=Nonomuraea mesophila TaxID=2530382 RepID=A0A4R5F2R6_9ACTN|nr:helix-turn-helix transcriptional regulator [Nonomuraea mesophila]TDE41866.1 transcriptional regulator [Nonomuraea mesophila]
MNTVNPTRELAVFLRTRRERLHPGDVALPARRAPRRTPGLRREEVAELAGVSVDYVTRLEQGRGLRPSPEVLEALAGALRLSEDERAYLYDLAGQRPARQRTARRTPTADDEAGPLARLVADLSPLPAMLVNHRFDIISWNAEMAALMLDFGTLPPEQRNSMWLCVRHPGLRGFYRDREHIIREGIADLRAAWAAHPDDTALSSLIDELTSSSEEVARLWALRDVKVNARGHKRLVHDAEGPLTVAYEVLAPLQAPGQRLVIYRAADPESQRVLDAVVRASPAARPRGSAVSAPG